MHGPNIQLSDDKMPLLQNHYSHLPQTKTFCKAVQKGDKMFLSLSWAYIEFFGEYGHALICHVIESSCNPLQEVVIDGGEGIKLIYLGTECNEEIGEGRVNERGDGVV